MKSLMMLIFVLVVVYAAYEAIRLVHLVYVSRGLVAHEEAFERIEGSRSILVLGDSTAVGVGVSDPKKSVAGRLSAALNASVENYAQSGAVTSEVAAQLAQAKKNTYDLILIQVGANDVFRFHDAGVAQADLKRLLSEVTKKSDRVVLLTAGKIGNAPFFPWFARSLMTGRAAALRERFKPTVEGFDAVYVDLYVAQDPFASDPKRYYAPDSLHLADDGYGFWYEETKKAIEAKWPDLYE